MSVFTARVHRENIASQGEALRVHRDHRDSESQGQRAQAQGEQSSTSLNALTLAGTLGLLALLVGGVVMLLSLADWQRSFVGGGVAAVGLLTLCFVVSIAVGNER